MRRSDATAIATASAPALAVLWWWARAPVSLAPPPDCAGLLETLGAAALRTWPDTRLAPALLLLHLAGAIVTVGALALAVRKLTASALAGAATGIACASTLVFAPVLGMPDTVVLAASALVWLSLAEMLAGARASSWTGISLVALAMLAPQLRVPAAATIAALAWPAWRLRHRTALIGATAWALAAMLIPAAISAGTPALPAVGAAATAWNCDPSHVAAGTLLTTAGIGLLTLMLAAAGLIDRITTWPARTAAIALVWWLASLSMLFPGGAWSVRAGAPALIGFWLLIGCGFGAVIAQARRARTAGAIAAAVATAALVIVIAAPRFPGALPAPPRPTPLGHEQLTAGAARALLLQIPSGSVIVREDAMTDLVLRAIAGRLARLDTSLRSAPPNIDTLADIRTRTRVFAWPHMQRTLQAGGFRIDTSTVTAAAGLAEITGGGRCVRATSHWQPMPSLIAAPAFTFIAPSTAVRGPVVLWLDGTAVIDAVRTDWPASAMRGFQRVAYELPGDGHDAGTQRGDDGAPGITLNSSAVTRVEVWRTPEAPLSLSVTLTAPPTAAFVRLSPDTREPVTICPSFPGEIHPIPPHR